MTIVLDLPIPPSVNKLWKLGRNRKTGKRIFIKSNRATSWAEQAAWSVRAQRKTAWVDGPCVVTIEIARPTASSDVDNRIKALVDSLQAGGAIGNDNQVAGLQIWWSKRVKGARVTIEKITPAQLKRLEGGVEPHKPKRREICPGCGRAFDTVGRPTCDCDEATPLPQKVRAA